MSLLVVIMGAVLCSGLGFVMERASQRGVRGPLSLTAIVERPRPWGRYLSGRVSRVLVRRVGAQGFELVLVDGTGRAHVLMCSRHYELLAARREWLAALLGLERSLDS